MTPDAFLDRYIVPIEVRGKSLEEVPSLYEYYRSLMLGCASVREMVGVAKEFQFLATEAVAELSKADESMLRRLRRLLADIKVEPDPRFQNFRLPPVIIHGSAHAREWGLQEYYGALQFYAKRLKEKPHHEQERRLA